MVIQINRKWVWSIMLKNKVTIIGLGNAGCKVTHEFQKLEYNTLLANGSIQDIKVLGNASNVYHLQGYDGFGGDRGKAMDCLSENMEFVEKLRNIESEIIYLIFSTGGSTGSSLGTIFVSNKKYSDTNNGIISSSLY